MKLSSASARAQGSASIWLLLGFLFSVSVKLAAAATIPDETTFSSVSLKETQTAASTKKHQGPKRIAPGDDIRLTEEQKMNRLSKTGILGEQYRWPKGRVFYSLDPKFNSDELAIIKQGMALISSKTCITFKDRKNNEKNYVKVTKGKKDTGCWSELGMVGNKQDLNLEVGELQTCMTADTVAHEFIHAIGFDHEHNRPDRDDRLTVLWENVEKDENGDRNHNLIKEKEGQGETYGVAYDFLSIMHYDETAFGINGALTMDTKPAYRKYQKTMGRVTKLSNGDIAKIKAMYKGYC